MFDDNGSFLLALFEFFLFFAWFMCLFWVIGDIFRSKDLSGVAKTFWVFFVIILPWPVIGCNRQGPLRGAVQSRRYLTGRRRARRGRRSP